MSYNVTDWRTKELRDFVIPVASLFKCSRRDWHPRVEDLPGAESAFAVLETSVVGEIDDEHLHVHTIDLCGEGSGTSIKWIWEPAFADSKGLLRAVVVWEGGDSIQRLTVDDGKVTWEDVEL